MKRTRIFISCCLIISLFVCACQDTGGGTETQSTEGTTASETSQATTTKPESTDDTETTTSYTTAPDYTYFNNLLKGLLPDRSGFTWKYYGFAEYGHQMTLDGICEDGGRTIYAISGMIDDMSGGESGEDLGLEIVYEVSEGKLVQYLNSGRILDSIFKEMIIIVPPFEKGASWTQTAVTKDGLSVELECEITDIMDEGIKTYIVRYEQKDSDYYEVREIREGTGIVAVNRMFVSDGDEFEIGYILYENISGYPEEVSLKSFLPPYNTELRYFGLAEYGHKVTWYGTAMYPDLTIYEMNGYFEDGSGIPGSFKVEYILDRSDYTITESVVENTRRSDRLINSLVSDMIILKAPVVPGGTWQQEVTLNGEPYTMTALITEAKADSDDPRKVSYTVRYTISGVPGYFNNEYLQIRTFMTGRGMVAFSQLEPGDIGISGKDLDDDHLVQQAIANHMFGYSQDLTQ